MYNRFKSVREQGFSADSGRVMIFIDGSNLYHSLKKFFKRADIDMGKFAQKLLEKRRLVRTYYYNARVGRREEPERYKDQEAFFESVASVPYTELRLGRLVYINWPNTPPYEKGVDIQLATDLLTHSFKNNFDVGVLVAGDNDYVGALQAVKDNGKHVEVALFGKERGSRQLREVADRIINIDGHFLRGCWKNLGPGGWRGIRQQRRPFPQTQPPPQQPVPQERREEPPEDL
ncbi:MAG: NYN domain-containing protein [Chloroflexota bacterium]